MYFKVLIELGKNYIMLKVCPNSKSRSKFTTPNLTNSEAKADNILKTIYNWLKFYLNHAKTGHLIIQS
jgi:hypothetical protein